jgi:GT2 family glycosyltransferase
MSRTDVAISIAIPTFGRESVLMDTIEALLLQRPSAAEILVIDQTPVHEPETERRLAAWDRGGQVRWLRLPRPSIPVAMNHALAAARCPIVLFLDDDIVPANGLIGAHAAAHDEDGVAAVVGQVLQPGQEPNSSSTREPGDGLVRDLEFPFHSTERRIVHNCMAGNLSVKRELALAAGGFDENFVGVAYRFETEFARQLERSGGVLLFEPRAVIRHLRAARGGTRTYGSHLTSARPEFSVGDYYFALKEGRGSARLGYIARRLFREVRTRFHLRNPWWIPIKLVGELRGLAWAVRLRRLGRRGIQSEA